VQVYREGLWWVIATNFRVATARIGRGSGPLTLERVMPVYDAWDGQSWVPYGVRALHFETKAQALGYLDAHASQLREAEREGGGEGRLKAAG
jgi:hypothetical protein